MYDPTSGNTDFALVIAMPAHNEASGIASFLTEIQNSFEGLPCKYVVVDDASSDGTAGVVGGLVDLDAIVLENHLNLGHGPSTLLALGEALATGAPFVIAVDGDGQFLGVDVRRVYDLIADGNVDVVEGVRTARGDPLFRRVTSLSTRLLVASRCGAVPRDANTPLRAYRAEVLRELLTYISPDTLTPNLFVSALVRKKNFLVLEVDVTSLPRRGVSIESVTWRAQFKVVPSRRFVKFCADATFQWVRRSIGDGRG